MGTVDQHLIEHVRRTIGVPLTEDEATALAQWYANIARAVAEFPFDDLKNVEPPLRSVAGPPVR